MRPKYKPAPARSTVPFHGAQARPILGPQSSVDAGSFSVAGIAGFSTVAIGGGSCSDSSRTPAERVKLWNGCHCSVANAARLLVLKCQFDGPMRCEYQA